MLKIKQINTEIKSEISKIELILKGKKLAPLIWMILMKWLQLLRDSFQLFKLKLTDIIIIAMAKVLLRLNKLAVLLFISSEDKDSVII